MTSKKYSTSVLMPCSCSCVFLCIPPFSSLLSISLAAAGHVGSKSWKVSTVLPAYCCFFTSQYEKKAFRFSCMASSGGLLSEDSFVVYGERIVFYFLIWLHVDGWCIICIGYMQIHEHTDVRWGPKAWVQWQKLSFIRNSHKCRLMFYFILLTL